MKKIKIIDENKRIRGVRLVWFCGKCKRDLTEGFCHKTKEERCEFSETHHDLKYYLNVPNGGGKREAKVLKNITNLTEAQAIVMARKQELIKGRAIKAPVSIIQKSIQEEPAIQKPEPKLLKDLLAQHIDILSDHNVPTHLKKSLSIDYLNDISRGYKYLMQAMKSSGYNINRFCISELNDDVIGKIHDTLLDKDGHNMSNRTYTKYFQFYSSFMDWVIQKKGIGRDNFFRSVPKRKTIYTPEIITKEAFQNLINMVRPENGIKETPGKKKAKRNLYRNWMTFSFKMCLETGRRRNEVAMIKWSDIYAQDSAPIYIKVSDGKVNAIMKLKDSEKRFVYVPITSGLYELIKEGFENYQKTNKDGYIIAPEIANNRKQQVSDIMSRSWAHYYGLMNPNENEQLSLGCLRASYLTAMELHTQGQTATVSGHGSGGKVVLNRHYISPQAIASVKASSGFSVFPDELTKRQEELKKARGKVKENEKTPEI